MRRVLRKNASPSIVAQPLSLCVYLCCKLFQWQMLELKTGLYRGYKSSQTQSKSLFARQYYFDEGLTESGYHSLTSFWSQPELQDFASSSFRAELVSRYRIKPLGFRRSRSWGSSSFFIPRLNFAALDYCCTRWGFHCCALRWWNAYRRIISREREFQTFARSTH